MTITFASQTSVQSLLCHSEGSPLKLKYSRDGQYLFTGGTDGIVRIFQTSKEDKDEEPNIIEVVRNGGVEEGVTAMDYWVNII
jgi:WD40 repeat protein